MCGFRLGLFRFDLIGRLANVSRGFLLFLGIIVKMIRVNGILLTQEAG